MSLLEADTDGLGIVPSSMLAPPALATHAEENESDMPATGEMMHYSGGSAEHIAAAVQQEIKR